MKINSLLLVVAIVFILVGLVAATVRWASNRAEEDTMAAPSQMSDDAVVATNDDAVGVANEDAVKAHVKARNDALKARIKARNDAVDVASDDVASDDAANDDAANDDAANVDAANVDISWAATEDGIWAMHDASTRQFLKDLEQGEHAHLPEDSPVWSVNERRAISIAIKQLGRPRDLLRFNVQHTATGYHVHVMWVLRSERGSLLVPPAGGGHCGFSISSDWQSVTFHFGA